VVKMSEPRPVFRSSPAANASWGILGFQAPLVPLRPYFYDGGVTRCAGGVIFGVERTYPNI
jgi:hypothetical protein